MIRYRLGKIFPTDARGAIHVLVGLMNVAMAARGLPEVAIIFGAGFLVYEVKQGDDAHKDIFGWLWGLAIGATVAMVFGYI